jgi:hypothetical protein
MGINYAAVGHKTNHRTALSQNVFLLRIDLPYLRPEKPTKLGLHHFLKTMPKRNPESNEFLDSSNSPTPPISFARQ